jgi:hypothetical protein
VFQGVSEGVEAGDVVVVDRDRLGSLRKGTERGDPGLVGVISGGAHLAMGGTPGPARAAVAVAGVVACKADAAYGEIEVGDLLTASPTPGHAMRADQALPGTVLGKALEPLSSGTGLIRVLVMLH